MGAADFFAGFAEFEEEVDAVCAGEVTERVRTATTTMTRGNNLRRNNSMLPY
jgi:hypothetical protein